MSSSYETEQKADSASKVPSSVASSKDAFSPKDYWFLVPALASGLAICFEIGSFVPIGLAAFGMFSLTEHIIFSMQALPTAVLIVTAESLVISMMTAQRMKMRRRSRTLFGRRVERPGRFIRRALRAVFVLAFAIGLILILLWPFIRSQAFGYAHLATAGLLVAFPIIYGVDVKRVMSWRVNSFVAVISSIIFAVCFGIDTTVYRVANASDLAWDVEIDKKSAKLLVLRAGDRGTLFYDPSRSRFFFAKSETIGEIAWPAIPHWDAEFQQLKMPPPQKSGSD